MKIDRIKEMNSHESKLVGKYGILKDGYALSNLDISETITELSYLTHSHFRYYGKFPSKLASHFLEKYGTKKSVLLDNYAGSGTSLVEAKLKGIRSYGLDINPLAVLACNVKTTTYKNLELTEAFEKIHHDINRFNSKNLGTYIPSWPNLHKWFDDSTINKLAFLKKVLLKAKFERPEIRDFFWLGYFGIIRRVSNAHDAEIRPHVNPKKKKRDVFEAYEKKIIEMIDNSIKFSNLVDMKKVSTTFLGSNTDLSLFPQIKTAGINLVLSHPPYLNCFDYIPVYNLEFQWAQNVDFLWKNLDLKEIKKLETKSWPATSEKILYGYFDAHKKVYEEIYKILKPGGICGIVIGDSTINSELIRVHKILASICESIGFDLIEIIYRSTHYGAGKYAYKNRADYHGNGIEGKKDGILVFRKR